MAGRLFQLPVFGDPKMTTALLASGHSGQIRSDRGGWFVIGAKDDWKHIFAFE